MQAKNYSILDWARQASMGCELAPKEAPDGMQLGTFLGGCFWGLELAMQRVPGVVKTSVGYTGGETPNPTYETVCSGRTGHAEAVQVLPHSPAACTPAESQYPLPVAVHIASHSCTAQSNLIIN